MQKEYFVEKRPRDGVEAAVVLNLVLFLWNCSVTPGFP